MTYARRMARAAVGKHFAGKTLDAYAAPVEEAILAVIERCAKVAEKHDVGSWSCAEDSVAGRIRALATPETAGRVVTWDPMEGK